MKKLRTRISAAVLSFCGFAAVIAAICFVALIDTAGDDLSSDPEGWQ